MKIIYYSIIGLIAFLFCGCLGCLEPDFGPEPSRPKPEKIVTIINRTNKEYKNNTLQDPCPFKSIDGKWKLSYLEYLITDWRAKIPPNQTLKNITTIDTKYTSVCPELTTAREDLFLLSLDGGKRKIFFGAHDYKIRAEYTEVNKETCRHDFVKWNIHPVFQEKELIIRIYEDRVEFSDPKIKEVKRLRVSYDEYVDPNTLPLVICKYSNCEE